MDPPRRKVARRVSGSFPRVEHTWVLQRVGADPELRHVLEYDPPMGILGKLFDMLFVGARVRREDQAMHGRLKALVERGP